MYLCVVLFLYGHAIFGSICYFFKRIIIHLGEKWKYDYLYYWIIAQRWDVTDNYLSLKNQPIWYIKSYIKKYLESQQIADSYINSWKKERIEVFKRRVFAYDYEELIFQMFTYKDENGCYQAIKRLKTEEAIKKISELRKLSYDEASKLFAILVNNQLIIYVFEDVKLGSLLDSRSDQWNIICNFDMNLDKWIEKSNKDRI